LLVLKDDFGVFHNLVLADAHTHLKIGSLEGLGTSEMIRRSHRMVRSIVDEMRRDTSEGGKVFRYSFPWEVGPEPPDTYEFCFKNLYGLVHPGPNLSDTLNHHLAVDFFATFSSDIPKEGVRDYRGTNAQIKELLVEKEDDGTPHTNPRFLPYGRVDPNHADAIDAVDTIAALGLRGLKLHPKEERFELRSEEVVRILYRCAEHDLPVIFHTQDGSVRELERALDETVAMIVRRDALHLLPRLKVIAGHAPWNGVDSPNLFRFLSHPSGFGEVSTLKADSMPLFFRRAKESISYEEGMEAGALRRAGRATVEKLYFRRFKFTRWHYWSSKLMYGSDTPYPPSNSARDLLRYALTREFPGTVADTQNVLGASLLRLVPAKARPAAGLHVPAVSESSGFHGDELERMVGAHSRLVAFDPLVENFPLVRVRAAVATFLRDGELHSYIFASLFDPERPRFVVRPYPGFDDGDATPMVEALLTSDTLREQQKS
jgi:predicted TIM-barrel fold metal-dependent hydrolase